MSEFRILINDVQLSDEVARGNRLQKKLNQAEARIKELEAEVRAWKVEAENASDTVESMKVDAIRLKSRQLGEYQVISDIPEPYPDGGCSGWCSFNDEGEYCRMGLSNKEGIGLRPGSGCPRYKEKNDAIYDI